MFNYFLIKYLFAVSQHIFVIQPLLFLFNLRFDEVFPHVQIELTNHCTNNTQLFRLEFNISPVPVVVLGQQKQKHVIETK